MTLSLLDKVKTKALSAIQGVGNYFNPTSNNGQNFWSSPVAQGAASVQKVVEPMVMPLANTLRGGMEEASRATVQNNPLNYLLNPEQVKLAQSQPVDTGKVVRGGLAMYGLTNPALIATMAVLNPAFEAGSQVVGQLVHKQPLNVKVDVPKSIGEGAEFGAILGPINTATKFVLQPLLKFINPVEINTVNNYLKMAVDSGKPFLESPYVKLAAKRIAQNLTAEAVSAGTGGSVYGATLPAKDLEERIYNTLTTGLQFAVFGTAAKGLGIGTKAVGFGGQQLLENLPTSKEVPLGLSTKPITKTEHLINLYRGGGEGEVIKGKTAQDIVNFEQQELGNTDIKPMPEVDLTQVPSENARWFTTTSKAAKEYGKVEKLTAAEKEFTVLATDGQGGVLVNTKPPKLNTLQTKGIADITYFNTVQNGGVTINLEGNMPKEGFAYAPSKTTETATPLTKFTPKDTLNFVKKYYNELSQPGNHVGTYIDDQGNAVLDVSQVGKYSPETLANAQKASQISVYDLKAGKEIPLGKMEKGVYNINNEATRIYDQWARENQGAVGPGGVGSVSEVPGGSSPINPAPQTVLKNPNLTEKVTPEVTNYYFKLKGSNQPDFIAGEKGISKVRKVGPKKFESLLPPNPELVNKGNALPSGKTPVKQLSASEEFKTWRNRVENLLGGQEAVKGNVEGIQASEAAPKGWFTKIKDFVIGDKSVEGSLGVIKNDSPAGSSIVDTIRNADEQRAVFQGDAQNRFRVAIKNLTDAEKKNFGDYVDGVFPITNNTLQKAVSIWKSITPEVRNAATEVGMEVGNIENYWPRIGLEKGGKVMDENFFIDRGANISYGNLVKSRAGAEFPYDKSVQAGFEYLDHAYKNITNEALFGPGDQNLYTLADKTTNPSQVKSYLDQILGKNQTHGVGDQIAKGLMGVQTITKLGPLSSVTNLTQNLSTVMRTDPGTVVKTISNVIKDPETALSRAVKSGEVDKGMVNIFEDYTGGGNIVSKWIHLIGMSGSEKVNRIIAVNSGYDFVAKLAEKAKVGDTAAIRELGRFRLTPEDAVRGLTEDQLIKAGSQVSQETQFATGPGELPAGWKTPLGKVATQFKSFAYKQTGFLKNALGRAKSEAGHGNFAPAAIFLGTLGITAPILGEVVADIRSLFRNQKRTSKLFSVQRYLENVAAASSFGLLDNLPGITGQYGESGVAGAIGGPTAGESVKGATALADFSKGLTDYDSSKSFLDNVDPSQATRRNLIKNIPVLGPTLSNTFVQNSYIQNYAGNNQGMSTPDQKVYDSLVTSGNTTKAEEYKQSHQYAETKPTTNILSALFGGGKNTFALGGNPTPEEISKFNSEYDKLVNAGGVPTPEQIRTRFFRNAPTDVKSNTKLYTTVKSVFDNTAYPDEYKQEVLKASGIDPNDFEFYTLASLDSSERGQVLMQLTQQESRSSVLMGLVMAKREIGGKAIATSTDIDYLYNMGLVSKDEKTFLNAVKFDTVLNKFYMDRDYKGGGMTDAKRKAIISKLNTIFKLSAPKNTKIKTISLPTQKPAGTVVLTNKLRLTPTKKAGNWFTA